MQTITITGTFGKAGQDGRQQVLFDDQEKALARLGHAVPNLYTKAGLNVKSVKLVIEYDEAKPTPKPASISKTDLRAILEALPAKERKAFLADLLKSVS